MLCERSQSQPIAARVSGDSNRADPRQLAEGHQKVQDRGFLRYAALISPPGTSRPKFYNNEFQADISGSSQSLSIHIGLMLMKADRFGKVDSQDINSAEHIAGAKLQLSLQRLKELGGKEERKYLDLMHLQKSYGKFQLALKAVDHNFATLDPSELSQKPPNVSSITDQTPTQAIFNPLISRIMFDENCQDPVRERNCLASLEQQSNALYSEFLETKRQEENYERLLGELEKDEQQLLQELDCLETVNSKITEKLNSKESLENLKLEIEMLKGTKEGKRLLLDKLEYFEDRIFREEEISERLSLEYKDFKQILSQKISQTESLSSKLKGKRQQEFEIENNAKLLENYDDCLYEYKMNEAVLRSLAKMSEGKEELTATQASLLLENVQQQLEMEKQSLSTGATEAEAARQQSALLEKIQAEMAVVAQRDAEEEDAVNQIKLQCLNDEIQRVRNKIERISSKAKVSALN